MKKLSEVIGAVVVTVALIALIAIVRGATISVFWDWFIQPVFKSAPDLRIIEAIGLGIVVSLMTMTPEKRDDKLSFWEGIGQSLSRAAAFYIAAWVVALPVHWLY